MHTLMLNFSLCLQPAVGLPTKITCMQENCKKSFSTPYNFHQHLHRHTNTFHFFCEVCGKGFVNKNHWQSHKASHTWDHSFFCEVCGKGFVNKNHWQSHKASHTWDHSFLCSKCSKSFTTKSNLTCHFKLCNNMTKKYQCVICGKYFIMQQTLNKHLVSAHKQK